MKRSLLLVLAGCAVGVVSAAELAFLPWFVQDYTGFQSVDWTDTKGSWTKGASDRSVFDAANRKLSFDTADGELAFEPAAPSNASCPAAVDVRMMFAQPTPVDARVDVDADAQASLVLCEVGEDLVFSGWTAAGWKNLSATGIVPATNVTYDVRVEMDYSQTPARVRYLVGGQALADVNGDTWFASAAGAKRQVSKVCFTGRGEVGTFSGEHRPPTAFTLDSVRAVPGEPVSLQVTTNLVPRGTVTYKWYLGGRDKAWSATPFATSAAPVLDASQCVNWVRVVAEDDDGFLGEKVFFYSRLPVAYLTTEGGKTPSPQKEDHKGTIYIQGNARYPDQYNGEMKIHVRGNSTKGLPKKPWKIKLDKKTDLFGFGKNKHWVLLANYLDVGLMRNTIAYDLSGELGLVHMKTTWVDVILNGAYQGCYQLCEHIRIGGERVDVYDWEDAAETLAGKFVEKNGLAADDEEALIDQLQQDFSWVTSNEVTYKGITSQPSSIWKKYSNDISGGYLFELSHEYDELSKFTVTNGNISLYVMLNAPEYLYSNVQMMDYCRTAWTNLVEAWIAPDGVTPEGACWLDLCDVDSMAAYWLAMEIPGNNDSSYKSRYAWKDQGGPLTFGPAWDFDWGCGAPVINGTNTTCSGWRVATSGDVAAFYREWGDDPYFALVLWEKYWSVRGYLAELLADDGIYDQSRAYIYESGLVDSEKWFCETDNRKGYTFEIDSAWFKQYLKTRVDWIDTKFVNVQTLMASIHTSNSRNPYTRCAPEKLSPTFHHSTPNSTTRETEAQDVRVPLKSMVSVDIATTSTSTRTITVRVNGRVVATEPVANSACSFELPATAFLEEGRRNMVDFIGYRADGTVTYRTWALVTCSGGSRIFIR